MIVSYDSRRSRPSTEPRSGPCGRRMKMKMATMTKKNRQMNRCRRQVLETDGAKIQRAFHTRCTGERKRRSRILTAHGLDPGTRSWTGRIMVQEPCQGAGDAG